MRDLVQTALDLVRIPSVTGHEEAICSHVEAWARQWVGDDEVRRVGNGLVLTPEARGGRPVVGLFGHLDTVIPSDDQPCEIQGDRLYGCGASDMKAGLAVMMGLVEQRAEWGCDLVAVFYDREEGPQAESGLIPILPLLPTLDLAVMLEPTANRLQLGCIGTLHARLAFRGRRAHSARPWEGDNAIDHALPLLERLRRRGRVEVRVDGLPFYEVMTATSMQTRNSLNVVPDELLVNVNYRFAPGRDEASARDEVLAMVAGEAEVEFRDVAMAGAVCREHPLVKQWLARCPMDVEPKQGWTDVARLTAHGVAAVNLGPGDPAQAHQAREWVAIPALDQGYERMSGLLQ